MDVQSGCRAASYVHMQKELRQFQRPIAQLVTKSYRTAAFVQTTAMLICAFIYLNNGTSKSITLARITRNTTTGERIDCGLPDETKGQCDDVSVIYHGHHLLEHTVKFGIPNNKNQIRNGCASIIQWDIFHRDCGQLLQRKYSSTAPITILNNNIGAINHMKKKDHNIIVKFGKANYGSRQIISVLTWIKVDRPRRKQIKLKRHKSLLESAGFDYEQNTNGYC
ncbi:hypothetical protein DERF_005059 [Dermatophagoides farinae]|uniref:Uncharacterized protein n=1 Tax=Dermatophagoides farinae TaxID=6954 RepID=A0A922L8B1_DERFA|nr:hypothetical protein DERF_005059 [Dermatophagoides farinae]